MPLGVVDDKEFDKELNNCSSEHQAIIVDMDRPGRKVGDNNVPLALQKVLAGIAIEEGSSSAKKLANNFGISDSSISAYKNGATSTNSYNEPNKELNNHNRTIKEKIVSRARQRMMRAINHITEDKLKGTKARDLAGIAKDMAVVVKTLEPEKEQGDRPNVQYVFYAPQIRTEDSFDRLIVSD